MQEEEADTLGQLALEEPERFNELVLKRSLDFKDPSYTKKPNT